MADLNKECKSVETYSNIKLRVICTIQTDIYMCNRNWRLSFSVMFPHNNKCFHPKLYIAFTHFLYTHFWWLHLFKTITITAPSASLKGAEWCNGVCLFSPLVTTNKRASIYRRSPPVDTPNPASPFSSLPGLLALCKPQFDLNLAPYQLR